MPQRSIRSVTAGMLAVGALTASGMAAFGQGFDIRSLFSPRDDDRYGDAGCPASGGLFDFAAARFTILRT